MKPLASEQRREGPAMCWGLGGAFRLAISKLIQPGHCLYYGSAECTYFLVGMHSSLKVSDMYAK